MKSDEPYPGPERRSGYASGVPASRGGGRRSSYATKLQELAASLRDAALLKEAKMLSTTIKYFKYDHLPPVLQEVSKPVGELAQLLEDMLPDGPEKSAGMRKLLEAKDCFVRAKLG